VSATASTAKTPWWQPGPIDFSKSELLLMRLFFAVMVFFNVKWETAPYTTQRNPTGLAHFIDFTWLAHHPPGLVWKGIVAAGLFCYMLGIAPGATLAPAALTALMIGTLVTSKAMQHSWHLVTLIVLAQFIVYAWPKRRADWLRPSLAVHRLAIYATTVVFAAAYVVCGVVKLVNSDFRWIQKVPYLSVQLLKSNWASYYDTLQPVAPWLDRATQAIVDYPNIARLFFGAGLLIELLGFVILINRAWAFWGGLAIIALHLSISKVMDLHFEYHMAAALVFLVLPNVRHALRFRAPASV